MPDVLRDESLAALRALPEWSQCFRRLPLLHVHYFVLDVRTRLNELLVMVYSYV
jgi:hypothetical protein